MFFPLFLSRNDSQRMGFDNCQRKLSQSFREVYCLAILVTSKKWIKKTHQCPLPGVSPDPGWHHHLLHHAAHGDGLENHSWGECHACHDNSSVLVWSPRNVNIGTFLNLFLIIKSLTFREFNIEYLSWNRHNKSFLKLVFDFWFIIKKKKI